MSYTIESIAEYIGARRVGEQSLSWKAQMQIVINETFE